MAVLIDATALHPATRLAIATLQSLEDLIAPEKILEIGCGNGILSLAALQLWDASVLACDISPNAIADAQENAQKFAPEADITILRSDGFKHPAIATGGPYDLIIANLLAQWHIAMAADMEKCLNKGGTLLLGGALPWQEEGLIAAFKSINIEVIQKFSEEGWMCYLLRRAP